MNILYVGDIMGDVGIETVEKLLSGIVSGERVDLVIAQSENVSAGRGIEASDYKKLRELGIDFFTGGNWSLHREEIFPYLEDDNEPIIRPANYPSGTPGKGFKYVTKNGKKTLVISLMGHIVGKDADKPMDNTLKTIDKILAENSREKWDACVVNLHGDFSSEKVILGHYLDGRVTAVVGDHWHVPTADARLLPKGTAHITDVGMCGALNASLGVKFGSVIPRWKDGLQTPNVLEKDGPRQFNAVLISTGTDKPADSIKQIQTIYG
jgi:2',3'-cyclic-nucleotide 2'-phosphodiesterase